MTAMKWWGWGLDGVSFTHEDKPELGPFILEQLGVDVARTTERSKRFEELDLPEPVLPEALRSALEAAVGAEHVTADAIDRVVHARGKSIRDLIRQRRGDLPRLVDVVVRPGSEDEVTQILEAVIEHDAVLIPFGGGSSISGSLEPEPEETRPVVSVDVGRLDKVLSVDAASRTARVQAGVFGPALEEQLGAQGWTFGHFPDSFTHSTLGGWIATRSSGMQSDRYGDIADLTRAVRMVTPHGTLATRPVPSQSTGPSLREMVLGSEGRLGLITEATVHVRRIPEERRILGYLFPTFSAGLAAMAELAASEHQVSVTRVSDAPETAFSFATRKQSTLLDKVQSKALQTFLKRRKGFVIEDMCLSFIGYEGSAGHVAEQKKAVGKLVGRHGGLCIGVSPGALYDQKKFDTPYIRDFLLDRGCLADVSETAAPWSELTDVYDQTRSAVHGAFAELGVKGYLMCHLSHSYHAGACLYFTFAFPPAPGGADMIEQYDVVKRALQQSFVDTAATLSHHHAVGTEHAEWLAQDVSPAGVTLLSGLFDAADPGRHLNPGKIVGRVPVYEEAGKPV